MCKLVQSNEFFLMTDWLDILEYSRIYYSYFMIAANYENGKNERDIT